jgi:Tol biopolymer transport system component
LRDRYVLGRELGRGGMATVYAAQDVRHGRQVAVKVLHQNLAATLGPERFAREIQLAAQLQHPHILAVHDSGAAAGFLYYVMPFVDGPSLRERLVREGELPVAEAVRLLAEIVDALAYAHAHGVVHRDIKPDNILLSGRHALVADLGVAKALSAAGVGTSGDAGDDGALTSTGMALGTPRYMAPEQMSADPQLDHRVDIYAVGVMAYEMLSGTRPFPGTTPQAVFVAQATMTPTPLEQLRPGIPPLLSQIVARCLAARPADRWQSADELLAQLERVRITGEDAATPAAVSPVTPVTPVATTAPTQTADMPPAGAASHRRAAAWGIAAALTTLAGVAVVLASRHPERPLQLGGRTPLTVDPGIETDPAVSPDGQLVAYAGGDLSDSHIFVRQMDGGRPIEVAPDVPGPQRLPYWSPDGKRLVFRSRRGLELIPALGGTARVLVPREAATVLLAGPWSPDGRMIAFVRSDSLLTMPVSGGTATAVTTGGELHSPAWSPDGRWIALVRGNRQSVDPDTPQFFGNLGQSALWLVPARPGSGRPVRLTGEASMNSSPAWLPGSRALLYLSNAAGGEDVYRIGLEPGATPGHGERITTGLSAQAFTLDAAGHRAVYAVLEDQSNIWSMPIPAGAAVGTADAAPVTRGSQIIETLDFSPDGHWLLFDSDRSGVTQVYRMPVGGGEPEQLTSDSSASFWARYSPDGRLISFHRYTENGRRLFIMGADGGTPTRLDTGPGDAFAAEWSRDGRGLFYLRDYGTPTAALALLPRSATGAWGHPTNLLTLDVLSPTPSPDGRWLAFGSVNGFMIATPRGDSARVIFPGGYRSRAEKATIATWSDDGRTMYYLARDSLDRATVWAIDPLKGGPRLLVRFGPPGHEWHRYGFRSWRGRFYFTLGEPEGNLWSTTVEAAE